MKTTKKIISVILIVTLVIGIVPITGMEWFHDGSVFSFKALASNHNGFVVDVESLTEVPDGYIGVYNIDDFKSIREDLSGKYILMNDIQFNESSWIPFGTYESEPFSGVFDGNGYSISGSIEIKIATSRENYCGLFAYNTGLIKNVSLAFSSASINQSGSSYLTGYYGVLVAANAGTIENCISNSTINYTLQAYGGANDGYDSKLYGGSFVGTNLTSGQIIKCSAKGNLSAMANATSGYATSSDFIGGISGRNYGKISSCSNKASTRSYTGNVIRDNTPTMVSGGIVGDNNGIIEGCYNSGSIVSSGSKATSSDSGGVVAYDGGIVGIFSGGSIDCCYNTGAVSATGSASASTNWSIHGTGVRVTTYVGGIAGGASSLKGSITESFNSGKVSASATTSKPSGAHNTANNYIYIGGIAGSVSNVNNCYNLGAVSANSTTNSTSDQSTLCIGGIAGKSSKVQSSYACCEIDYTTTLTQLITISSGEIAGSGTVSSCYAVDVPEMDDNVTYLLENELKDSVNLLDLDFVNVWDINPVINDGFPYLRKMRDSYLADAVSVIVDAPNNKELYKGNILKLTNTTKGTSSSVYLTEKENYTLYGNGADCTYKVELCSKNGSVFGTIENIKFNDGEKEAHVSFKNLSKPCTAAVKVLDETGKELTKDFSVKWYDENAKYLSTGTSINNISGGRTISYSVQIQGALAGKYVQPKMCSVTVSDDSVFECRLERIKTITVSGIVKDETGNAIEGATVSFVQSVTPESSNNVTVQTNSSGSFTASVYNIATEMSVSKDDYTTHTWSGTPESRQAFQITLKELKGARFKLSLFKKYTADPSAAIPVTSAENMKFDASNATTGKTIANAVVQYPYLVIPFEDINQSDKIRVAVSELSGSFSNAQAELVYDGTDSQTIDLTFLQKGHVEISLSSSKNTDNMALVFTSTGNHVETIPFTDLNAVGGELSSGQYQVVIMGRSDLFYNAASISYLSSAGLKEGTDYIKKSVDVSDGTVAKITNVSVPAFDESKFYYTEQAETTVSLGRSEIAIGQTVQLKASFEFKNKYADSISDAVMQITIPDNCEFVENTLMLDNLATVEYTISNHVLSIPVKATSGIVKVYLRPSKAGESVNVNAAIAFKISGEDRLQPIGSTSLNVTEMELYVPAKTAQRTNTVIGKTMANAVVEIYDNNVIVAKTTANAVGSFSATYNLMGTSSYLPHNIYAKVTLNDGTVLFSQTEQMIYDTNNPALWKITMISGGSSIEFDYLNPSKITPVYNYTIGATQTFTFKVSFTINDPEKVKNVKVITVGNNGEKLTIPVNYDKTLGLWVGAYTFSNSNLPASVYATFDSDSAKTGIIQSKTGTSVNQNVSAGNYQYTTKPYSEPQSGTAYGLSAVYPTKGSNGTVTVRINGSKLEANLKAVMSKGAAKISAKEIYYMSPSTAYATFDFSSAENGKYTLTASCGENTASLNSCFTVDSALPKGNMVSELKVSEKVKTGMEYEGFISVTNDGYTDVYAPILTLGGENVSFSLDDMPEFTECYTDLIRNEEGLCGVLANGETAVFNFKYKTSEDGDFEITVADYAKLNTVDQIYYGNAVTEADFIIADNFKKLLGATNKDYCRNIALLACNYSQFDDMFSLTSLTNAYESSANGTVLDRDLIGVTDVSAGCICASRHFSNDIQAHFSVGPFGYGWLSDDFIYSAEIGENEDYIALNIETEQLFFFKSDDGKYTSLVNENSRAEIVGDHVEVQLGDSRKMIFNADGTLYRDYSSSIEYCEYSYDSGRLIGMKSGEGEEIAIEYSGNKISLIKNLKTNQTTTFTYSGDYLSSVTDEYGTTSYEYNIAENGAKKNTLKKITYPNGLHVFYTYDEVGRLRSATNDEGVNKTEYVYHSSNSITVKDSVGNASTYWYNAVGENVRMIDASGNVSTMSINENEVTCQISSNSSSISSDNGVQYVDPNGYTTYYQYFADKGFLRLTDANGQKTDYYLDENNQTTKIVYPDAKTEQMEYDDDGNLLSKTDRSGAKVTYTYKNDQLISEQYSSGDRIDYTYDAAGQMTAITENGQTTTISYNEKGERTKVSYPSGTYVAYAYDAYGNLIQVSDSLGHKTGYSYDIYGRVSCVTDGEKTVAEYVYNSDSTVARQNNANGTYTVYSYQNGKVSSIKHFDAADKVLSYYDYSYDAVCNVIEMQCAEGTWQYAYDAAGQLTEAIAPDGTKTTYTYDGNGNRISASTGGKTTAYTVNVLNQYTKVGDMTLTYDSNGNLIKEQSAQGTATYAYDYKGRLSDVKTAKNETYHYTYDVFDNRSSATVNGNITEYINNPDGLGYAFAAVNGSTSEQYYICNGIVAKTSQEGTCYYNGNLLGSVTDITNADGIVVNSYTYAPDGSVLTKNENMQNEYTFLGKYGIADNNNGLLYIRARHYMPEIGRFISMDPSGQTSDLNLYRYTLNNYEKYTDLDGNEFNPVNPVEPINPTGSPTNKPQNKPNNRNLKGSCYVFRKCNNEGCIPPNMGCICHDCNLCKRTNRDKPIREVQEARQVINIIGDLYKCINCNWSRWVEVARKTMLEILRVVAIGATIGLAAWGILAAFGLIGSAALAPVLIGAGVFLVGGMVLLNVLSQTGLAQTSGVLMKSSIHKSEKSNKKMDIVIVETVYKRVTRRIIPVEHCKPHDPTPEPPLPVAGRGFPGTGKIDPSGYVCEAVASNRLEGVTATIFYKASKDAKDGYLWDASTHDQMNPLVTDENGYYEWFVPEAWWQVRYEKDGYITAYSDWLPVPPPQLDVNIALTSALAPKVTSATAYPDGVELRFSQYMDISTINADNVSVRIGEQTVTGSLYPLNSEKSFNDDSVEYASVFKFVPETAFEKGKTVSVSINHVKNYAGTEIDAAFSGTAKVVTRPESINVDETLPMKPGESKTVTLNIAPSEAGRNRKVIISSNNPEVVTVSSSSVVTDSNGKATITVNALLPGAATLTFSVENTELEAKMAVGVDNIEPESELIALTGISLDQTSLNLSSGNSQKLEVTFTPADATNQAVTWKSDNPKVATVDANGLVTAIGSGTTTIRVTSEEGGFTASCKITVKKPSVKSVSIGDIELQYKSSTVLKPVIDAESGASYTVTYSSSNPSIVSVDKSGKVTSQKQSGLNRGSAVITVTVTDSNGNTVTDTCKVTVQFTWWQWLIKIVLFGWIWY